MSVTMDDPHFQYPFASPQNASGVAPDVTTHHILTGSFRSLPLFLLAFSPLSRKLSWVKTVSGEFGPHQFLAKVDYGYRSAGHASGKSVVGKSMRVYGTSWALPPMLHCWGLERGVNDDWQIWNIGKTPITAVSSYITVPPPYGYIYSTGGPTGEVHHVDKVTGGFGAKVQEILFVDEDKLKDADKTRVALRYGSHAIEFTPDGQLAFIPVLGTNSIEMYAHDPATGRLTHVVSVSSPRRRQGKEEPKDGPRHVKVRRNGRIVYCVTEHSNMIDAYRIVSNNTGLQYISSRSLLPKSLLSNHKFRGDTLMLSPASLSSHHVSEFIVTTTRGPTPEVRGWLSIFALDDQGEFVPEDGDGERYETPTSGGKANAIDLLAKEDGKGVWILLTDDDERICDEARRGISKGAVRVLEWNGFDTGGIKMVAEWPGQHDEANPASIMGASHAIWLD